MKLTTLGDIDMYLFLLRKMKCTYINYQYVQSHDEQRECSALHTLNDSKQKWRVTFDHIEILDPQKCLRKYLADYPPTPNKQT